MIKWLILWGIEASVVVVWSATLTVLKSLFIALVFAPLYASMCKKRHGSPVYLLTLLTDVSFNMCCNFFLSFMNIFELELD